MYHLFYCRVILNNVTDKFIISRNLLFDISDEQIRKYFQKFGTVDSALAVRDPRTRLCRGSGFVRFESAESAHACLDSFARHQRLQQRSTLPEEKEELEAEADSPSKGDSDDAQPQAQFRIGDREVFVCAALSRERLAQLRQEREAGLGAPPAEGNEVDDDPLGESRRRTRLKPKHQDVRNMSLSLVGGVHFIA